MSIYNDIMKDMLLYGQSMAKVTHVPQSTWRMINQGTPMTKTPKPKRLTLREQVEALTREKRTIQAERDQLQRDLNRKEHLYERACSEIAWYKDTVRQMIAAMGRR